jgi:hypothetical protein
MKKTIITLAALLVTSTSALAGSFTGYTAPSTPLVNWSGSYVGGTLSTGISGVSSGAFIGHRVDMGAVVLGAEVGVSHNFSNGINSGTVEGNMGYDMNSVLPYVSGGWTSAGVQVYGVGIDYKLTNKVTLGAKWSRSSRSNTLGARVGFNF